MKEEVYCPKGDLLPEVILLVANIIVKYIRKKFFKLKNEIYRDGIKRKETR